MVFRFFDMQYRSQSMVKIYMKYGKCQGLSWHEMAIFDPDCARVLWLGVEVYKFSTSKSPLIQRSTKRVNRELKQPRRHVDDNFKKQ